MLNQIAQFFAKIVKSPDIRKKVIIEVPASKSVLKALAKSSKE